MEWSYPWLSIDGDRLYDDSDFAQFFANIFSTGVSLTTADALKVTENSNGGMRIMVGSGAANLQGRSYFNSTGIAMNVSIASSTQERTDSVVVRMDKGTREIKLVVKTGNTTVQRSSDIYELQLATIKVPRNASAITADLITDTRADEKVCGYSSPFQKVSVSGLEEQYEAILQSIIDKMNQYTADQKTKFEADMKAILAKGETYITQAQADWQEFLATIQESMDGDVALNLQNKLMNLTADQLVFSKTDLPFEYPNVVVLAWTNGFGVTALGEADWLGDVPETIPTKIGYPSKNAVTVKVPTNWKMASPKITEISEHVFLLNEGNKSLQITLKETR